MVHAPQSNDIKAVNALDMRNALYRCDRKQTFFILAELIICLKGFRIDFDK